MKLHEPSISAGQQMFGTKGNCDKHRNTQELLIRNTNLSPIAGKLSQQSDRIPSEGWYRSNFNLENFPADADAHSFCVRFKSKWLKVIEASPVSGLQTPSQLARNICADVSLKEFAIQGNSPPPPSSYSRRSDELSPQLSAQSRRICRETY